MNAIIKKWVINPRSVSEQILIKQRDSALMDFVSADWSTKESYERSKVIYETLKSICKVAKVINDEGLSNG